MTETTTQKLLRLMAAYPPLYAPGDAPFWDDPHISEYMLEAHLNPDWDAASRKPAYLDESAAWIYEYCGARKGLSLLDLGCGPGLYASRFTAHGFTVTGVDFSKRSIAYARQAAQKAGQSITYVYQNYLDIAYDNAFDAVVLIYCDYGVLPTEDRKVLLRKILRALRPGGVFILDGWTAHDPFTECVETTYQTSGFWSAEPHLCILRNHMYADTANTLEQDIIVTQDACTCYNIWNQIFTAETLTKELTDAGFASVDLFDDVAGKPYTGEERTLCAAARK